MRKIQIAVVAALAALTFAACSGGSETTSEPTGGGDTGGSTADLTVTAPSGASNSGFAETSLTATAGEAFSITFVNEDGGIPHNVQIFEGTDTSATPVFAPENNAMITGVDETMYEVPALEAGTYTYNCYSHPATMVGTLTVS